MSSARELPNIAEILGPLLERVSREQRPVLIAIAERMAAERYREWAKAAEPRTRRSDLLACAELEEQSAAVLESILGEKP